MTKEIVPPSIADLLAASRLAADFLCRGAGGDAGKELGETLRASLAGAMPTLRRVSDAEALPAFVDTLAALASVARRSAMPAVSGPEHVLLDGAIQAADELLAGWKASQLKTAPPGMAEVVQFSGRLPRADG